MPGDVAYLAAILRVYTEKPIELHKTLFLAQLVSLRETSSPLFDNKIIARATGPHIPDADEVQTHTHPDDIILTEFLFSLASLLPWNKEDLCNLFQGPESLWRELYQEGQDVEMTVDTLDQAVHFGREEGRLVDYVLERLAKLEKLRHQGINLMWPSAQQKKELDAIDLSKLKEGPPIVFRSKKDSGSPKTVNSQRDNFIDELEKIDFTLLPKGQPSIHSAKK